MEAARSIVGHQATLKDERHQAQVLNQVLGPSERGALLWGTGRKPVMLALLADEEVLELLTPGVR